MKPFVRHTGVVAPLDRANVDTDAIIPKQFLKRIERSGFGKFLFYEFRFDENGQPIEDFVLNKPTYKNSTILISRANFGCGSSREHAPWALSDFGFKVIIAPSFADIFYNNCFNNCILPIKLEDSKVEELFKNAAKFAFYKLEVDLEKLTIKDSEGLSFSFQIDEFRREKLLKGYDDISLTLLKEAEISAYEKQHISF